MILKQYIGDSHIHTIPLTWNGAAFSPGSSWVLIFTLKERSTDADADAIAQKTNGLGLEISGTNALVSLVPADTDALEPAPLYRHFDVQAQHIDTGEIRTVAIGQFTLQRDITRLPQTSVPIHTTEDPQPAGPFTPAAHAASHATDGNDPITPESIGAAAASHNQAISTITGLQTALDGKAASSHTHAISDVTGLQTALDGKAAASHTHAISDVTGLQTALDGKAASSHTHDVLKSADGTTLVKVGTDYTGTGGAKTGVEQGLDSTASGSYSHAEGRDTTASGSYSHAEGNGPTASGASSHAEGTGTTASGNHSHAEGIGTTASGSVSHAEGFYTTASGSYSHAEGNNTTSSGDYSRAAGRKAKAIHDGSSVETDSQDADCESTAANQKTFRYANGYRFLGGEATFETHPSSLATAAQGALADTALQPTVATKTTPVDADTFEIQDSAASGARKLLSFANLKTWLQSWIDAITTIAGAKTFSGQMQLTGQSATDANSAMTRGLADTRYAKYGAALSANFDSDQNTTTYKAVPGLTFSIVAGTYEIDCFLAHNGGASFLTAGAKDRITFSGTSTQYGFVYRAQDNATTATSFPNALISRDPLAENSSLTRSLTSSRKGVIVATTSGTIQVEIAQAAAVAGANTTLTQGSFLTLTRII